MGDDKLTFKFADGSEVVATRAEVLTGRVHTKSDDWEPSVAAIKAAAHVWGTKMGDAGMTWVVCQRVAREALKAAHAAEKKQSDGP